MNIAINFNKYGFQIPKEFRAISNLIWADNLHYTGLYFCKYCKYISLMVVPSFLKMCDGVSPLDFVKISCYSSEIVKNLLHGNSMLKC